MSTLTEQDDRALWDGVRRFATLPAWLDAATQPKRFIESMRRAIPEFASGALTIHECDIGNVRLKRDFWTGAYELIVGGPGAGERRDVALRGTIFPPTKDEGRRTKDEGQDAPHATRHTPHAFGTNGWEGYLPDLNLKLEMRPPDAALPALPILTDPHAALELLERSIRAADPRYHDLRLAACTPKIMRYTPGSRCTILY